MPLSANQQSSIEAVLSGKEKQADNILMEAGKQTGLASTCMLTRKSIMTYSKAQIELISPARLRRLALFRVGFGWHMQMQKQERKRWSGVLL